MKNGLYDRLLSSLDQKYDVTETPDSLAEWAVNTPIILDGKPFTFDRHEYLIEPYSDPHLDVTHIKGTQMGLSTLGMLQSVYGARYRGLKGILYLFPSRADVLDFSRARVTPLVKDNEETIGKWLTDTDSAGLKKVWNAHLYFRGMRSAIGLKSIPIDFLILDELDEANQNAIDMAMARMSHSTFKEVLRLSNPTLPDFGIDLSFQETDQRYWHIKCPSCGHFNNLDETFPDCLLELKDRVIRACIKCRAELDPSVGEWVAKHPSVTEKRGYHYSQLFSLYVDPGEILHLYRTTKNFQDFYNLKLGRPYVEAQNRLSVQEVLSLCGNGGILSEDRGPCSMGVDQGKDLHVVIGKKHAQKAGEIVHIGIYKDWEELDRLMRNFNVSRCVVDALPETRNARAFALRFKGKVFMNYYSIHQKGSYQWNEEKLTVSCNRTESLDASHREIMDQDLILPRENDIVREFANHLHNVAKRLIEDETTGSKRYQYIRLGGPDHFRHSFNYEALARSVPDRILIFPELLKRS